ncbi:Phage terminase-like protein, large subunit, contains N-terminal HTH domain [Pasteurella testudinis DSM 23072]|uniref:Phage terminase-like protein, large subunit, contains N-terminal HTH domain n=1 Tax=Pasteurella testudinis DSM 23072 TaxID=1122938 RepID=A0A1W1V1W6_9PAST|nr:terminase large subunit [Pasteurella testudinis]SMB87313.1 Phage terminase-like protein, large subunit, contains N-terminal HTH domain [Pasteurella testudinis DSM 23072]SUB51569.1 phage D3 terminase family protein [Pasteurella testudinis]SUB98520.1 phage D3 terminase family protein [Pasteurella testudinis]
MSEWHNYATAVKDGQIIACKRIKQAVARYFSDLENPRYTFDESTVNRFMAFAKLCPHVKGHLRGQPIELSDWQQFLFANLFGFKHKETGLRKYRSAYVQVARKNAKSTIAAVLANWFLIMEPGQQDIYTAAVSRDQARIVFDDARQMCLLSKPLKKRVSILQHKMIYPKNNSLMRPLAAKSSTIEGTNPSLAIVDEYHLHSDNSVYSALELGQGARPEGLLFAITTAGSNVISACKQHYDYCCQILDGNEQNDSLFVLIFELDEESEIDNPDNWIKANPNIGKSIPHLDFENTIKKARGIPSEWVEMLTKRFNVWCQGSTPWLGDGNWAACQRVYSEADLHLKECYMGLDLSSTNDLTSVCYAFPHGNKVRLYARHYIPEFQLNNVANKNRAIYRQWVRQGWLITTEGDCIDYDKIRDDILKDAERFELKTIGFDVWNATHLRTQLQGAGLEVEPFPQTYQRFSPVAKSAEVLINRQVIEHNGDPVLAWALSNVVMETDANANIKPNKKKAANKIDPAIAFLMAFGTYQLEYGDIAFEMSESHKTALDNFNGIDL